MVIMSVCHDLLGGKKKEGKELVDQEIIYDRNRKGNQMERERLISHL
jgi:hypothetical protein